MNENGVTAVLSQYGLSSHAVHRVEALANAGGWSGSSLWRIADQSGNRLCLRRWPREHPSRERLTWIHDCLLRVAPSLPIVSFPLRNLWGQTFVESEGHLWELTYWRPGTADFHASPTLPRLRAALRTLATFHQLSARGHSQTGQPPAVHDRIQQLRSLTSGGLINIENALRAPLHPELDHRAPKLLEAAKLQLATSSLLLRLAAIGPLPLSPTIRDIHHDHLLFIGDELTGLIDFGAMRLDTPFTDIARLVGSLAADDRQLRQSAFDHYHEIRPLSESDRTLIDLLDESGLLLGAMNWLTWLYVERRDMGPSAPIVHRLDAILSRMQKRPQQRPTTD
jgi:aminoglycoside phosphotransferase (APT) family kinase protein